MTTTSLNPFHLAFPVTDLEETRDFYLRVLGCREGRSDTTWVDFDFFGHQIVAHLRDKENVKASHGKVDGDDVPVPHFGAVLSFEDWHALADRLKAEKIDFIIAPRIRFEGQPGEQGTFFFKDPSGNALEFKAFNNADDLFKA